MIRAHRFGFVLVALGLLSLLQWPLHPGGGATLPEPALGWPRPIASTESVVGWLDPRWAYRIAFTASPDSIQGTGSFLDFTLLLRLSNLNYSAVFSHAKANGTDLVITKGDGFTVLPREVVSYYNLKQRAEIWFKTDTLSKSVNRFYLYYGNPDTTIVPPPGAGWTPSHLAVYHFSEDPGGQILPDHGPHGNYGTAGAGSNWTSADTVAGAIGAGWRFNGTTDWVDADRISSPDSSFTVSGWFACWNLANSTDFAFATSSGLVLIAKISGTDRQPDFDVLYRSSLRFQPFPLPDTLLHRYTWTLDGVADTVRFYYDGVEKNYTFRYLRSGYSKVYEGVPITGNVSLGGNLFGNSADQMEGIVDEFQVYRGVRTPAWIRTEYRNQKYPDGFYGVTPEEPTVGIPDEAVPLEPRLRAFPNPFRSATALQFDLAEVEDVEIRILDIAGRRIRDLYSGPGGPGPLRVVWDGRSDGGFRAASGLYFVQARMGGSLIGGKLILTR